MNDVNDRLRMTQIYPLNKRLNTEAFECNDFFTQFYYKFVFYTDQLHETVIFVFKK